MIILKFNEKVKEEELILCLFDSLENIEINFCEDFTADLLSF